MRRVVFFSVILSMLVLAVFSGSALAEAPAGDVSVAGSTTVQPLAQKCAEAFMKQFPEVKIDVQGGGSSVGVKSAGTGAADIGMASREIKGSEFGEYPELNVYAVALDGIAVVVNPGVGVSDMTKAQVADVFSGKITNWKDLGGADTPITVVAREEGSGTRAAFEELVMGADNPIVAQVLLPSNGAVRTAVAETEDSIGFLSFGYLDGTTKAVAINGVAPTVENAYSGAYGVVRPLNMLTYGKEPKTAAVAFINWILSSEGQTIVKGEGYMPVLPAERMTGSIKVAGSTTVQPLAQRLAEGFMFYQPGVKIDVQGGGSSVGVKSANTGAANVGMASREIHDNEKADYPNMRVYTIALDGIAVVAHPTVVVTDLTKAQVADIFAGKITNWSEVGGDDMAITVVAREEGSGTRAAFEELVMGKDNPIVAQVLLPSNGAVRTAVAETEGSIGFISFGYLDNSVKAVAVDGAAPTVENAKSGAYRIVRPLNMLTGGEPNEPTASWLKYVLGPNGQNIVQGEGYMKAVK